MSIECGKITINSILYTIWWFLVPTCLNTQYIYLHFINIQIHLNKPQEKNAIVRCAHLGSCEIFSILFFFFRRCHCHWFLHVPFVLNKIKYKISIVGCWRLIYWWLKSKCLLSKERKKAKSLVFLFMEEKKVEKGF